MSTNCLVTKLKDSVDNYNLSFFDSISLRYTQRENVTASSQSLRVGAADGPVIVEALDGGTLSTTYGGESIGSTFTVTANTTSNLYVSNHTGRIILHNKQNIRLLNAHPSSELCKDFDYANALEYITGPFDFSSKRTLESIKSIILDNISIGNLKNIHQRENLEVLRIPANSNNFYGSLEDLSGCRSLSELHIANNTTSLSNVGGNLLSLVNTTLHILNIDKNLSVIGDFENLAQCLILYYNKYGNITNTNYQVSNSGIGGSVQAFVNTCVDGGVTSGTVPVPYFKATRGIYSDLEHTLLIKDDPNVASISENNILSWSSDKTWTVS